MKFKTMMFGFMVLAFALWAGAAKGVTLPGCVPNVTCLQFGDFNVFSLPLLNLQATGSAVPSPGDPFFVSSTYGQIQLDTIIGINNGNCTDTGNPAGAIDCSYNTPSPNTDISGTFSTGTTADPGGTGEFAGDIQAWDATISDLLAINGTPLVAYFAFNETGSGTGLLTTDLLVWAQVQVCDLAIGGIGCQTFFLGGNTQPSIAAGDLPAPDGSDANGTSGAGTPAGFGSWVYVHAGICTDDAGNFLGFPDTTGACASGSVRNQNNLGQNAAAFAIDSPALDAALLNSAYDVLHVTWLMAYINGGGETAFILPTESVTIPEPGTLVLLGLGLLALGGVARRR